MPKISLIICTYNRSENIKALLEDLLTQEPVQGGYEIIVVNNNSADHTKETVESYLPKFEGKLRYFFESRQGKPFALNLGIKESRGEILAFTDDDCLVGRDYLAQVDKVFEEHGRDIDFMGGKIQPLWEGGTCPSWLEKILFDETEYALNDERYWKRITFRGPLAMLDYGKEPFPVDKARKRYESFLFYGPNMAVRRNAFDKIGGYATERVITQDTEILLRLINAGMKGWYAPNIQVRHRVQVAELTPEFYCQWYFQRGKFLERSDISTQKKFYHPLGIQNELLFRACKLFLKSIVAKSIGDKTYYRCRMLLKLAQMGQIAKRNII